MDIPSPVTHDCFRSFINLWLPTMGLFLSHTFYHFSLTPPLFNRVPVPCQESERPCIIICVRILDFASFFDFSIVFWNCSNTVVFFVFLLYLGTVPTVWYFLFFYCILGLFRQCGIFCFPIVSWDCSDSVVFFYCILELFRHWYFLFCVLWYH